MKNRPGQRQRAAIILSKMIPHQSILSGPLQAACGIPRLLSINLLIMLLLLLLLFYRALSSL